MEFFTMAEQKMTVYCVIQKIGNKNTEKYYSKFPTLVSVFILFFLNEFTFTTQLRMYKAANGCKRHTRAVSYELRINGTN